MAEQGSGGNVIAALCSVFIPGLGQLVQGARRFEEFVARTGATRATLTNRLRALVEEGILDRVRYSTSPPRFEYRMTRRGRDLFPVALAAWRWERRWAGPRGGVPTRLRHEACGHATLHARAQQFAARVTGRLFTAGMQYWQLGEAHYWGHNAIIRVEAFMKHCALAPIAGTGGLSGGIMSHDFVEAALMRRAGYHVWLVSDLTGSYEQQPPDLLSELQRDRRWCQGNLQNSRLMAEPGIHRVHRSMFAIGAMSYLSAPMWLAFLAFGTALCVADPSQLPGWYDTSSERLGLWIWTLCLLFLPRVLGLLAVFLKGEQKGFGGAGILLSSALLESALALLQAPIRMVAHSLFVLVAVTGIKLDWKSPPREAVGVAWRGAFAQLAPIAAVIGVLVFGVASLNIEALVWMLPVTLPLLLAVPFTVATGHVALGSWMRARGALLIPEESWSPAVLRRAWRHASRLSLLKAA